MTNDLKKRIRRLPQWARVEIERLEAEIHHLKQQAQILTGNKETNIYFQTGAGLDEKLFLPADSPIHIELARGTCGEIRRFRIRIEEELININSSMTMLYVQPRAANSIDVTIPISG